MRIIEPRSTNPPASRTPTSWAAWQQMCERTGISAHEFDHRRLIKLWSSRFRRYHTLDHLTACLLELEHFRSLAQRPGEVALALWFHDAVYSTRRSGNEERSAQLAGQMLQADGAPPEMVMRIQESILATRHHNSPLEGDPALVVDIDLSILGASAEKYAQFEADVRREYWWVPQSRFVTGRCDILRSFLDRPHIYHFEAIRQRYEANARVNLTHAIEALTG